MTRQQISSLGGRAVLKKYDHSYFSALGKKGFAATVNKHWAGDRKAFVRRLVELGLMAQDPVPSNGAWQYPRKEGEPW